MAATRNKFVLYIHVDNEDVNKVINHVIKGNSLNELLGKLPILVVEIRDQLLKEERGKYIDDDIPF